VKENFCYFNFRAPVTIVTNWVTEPTNVRMKAIQKEPRRRITTEVNFKVNAERELKGHRSRDCWNKDENKDKRPANW
jgi:hypothetical protein